MIFKFYIAFILHIKQYAHAPTPPLKNPMISTLYPKGGRTFFCDVFPCLDFSICSLVILPKSCCSFYLLFLLLVHSRAYFSERDRDRWDSCTHAKMFYLRLLEMKCSACKSKTRRFEFASFFSKKGIEKGKQRSNNVDWRC